MNETPTKLPLAHQVDIEVCHQAYLLRQSGMIWKVVEEKTGLRVSKGLEAYRAAKRWRKWVLENAEVLSSNPEIHAEDLPLEICRQAHVCKDEGETWETAAEVVGIEPPSAEAARLASERWLKACLDECLCERCGKRKNHLNTMALCNKCHNAVHLKENERNILERDLEKADEDALEGLNRFLASIGHKSG